MINIEYNSFTFKKTGGGYRTISSPSFELKQEQYRLKYYLDNMTFFPKFITGFVKGKNIKNNAKFHVNKKYLINLDIKDFFGSFQASVIKNRLALYINPIYLNEAVRLVTYSGSLPQGAPTSPLIANLVFSDIDKEIIDFLNKNGLKNMGYSRYADDISISFDSEINSNIIINGVTKIINTHDFKINTNKTRVFTNTKKMVVTGLVVNEKVSYPKFNYRLIRSKVYNLLSKDFGYFPEIKGHLNFLKSIDIFKYEKLKDYYFYKFKDNGNYYSLFNIKELERSKLFEKDKIRNKKRYCDSSWSEY